MAYIHPPDSDGAKGKTKMTGPSQPPPTETDRVRGEVEELLTKAAEVQIRDPRLAHGYETRAHELLDQTAEPTHQ